MVLLVIELHDWHRRCLVVLVILTGMSGASGSDEN